MAKEIPLSRCLTAIVDDEDYEDLIKYSWWADAYGYALTTTRGGRKNKKNIRMHRMIMNALPEDVVDHADGNPLNNQKSNLRLTSQANNVKNRRKRKNSLSGYKGLTWYKAYQKWQVRVSCEGKCYHLGYFDCKHEAARVYNAKALELFGEYARLIVINET